MKIEAIRADIAAGVFSDDLYAAAHQLAYRAHEGQEDKAGNPYIFHPFAVAFSTIAEGHEPAVCAIAVLHDVVEDTEVTYDDIRRTLAPTTDEATVERILVALEAITHLRHEPRSDYYDRILTNEDAWIVKRHDYNHNTLPAREALLTEEQRARNTTKYAKTKKHLLFE